MSGTDRSTTRTVIIASLALVVTFVAGFIAGVVTDRLLMHGRGRHRPPPMVAHAMMHRLDRALDLTDQQEAEIRKILDRRHDRMSTQMHAELQQVNAEIERVLTPAQREKFKDLRLHLGPRMRREGRERREPTR